MSQPGRGEQHLGWHVLVGLTVGQRQGVQELGVAGGEHLADRAAGVVRDEVDVAQLEARAEPGQEAGESGQGEVLVRGGRSQPVQRQVDGHAAALAVELVDHVPPQVAAGAQAVDEQRYPARAARVDVAGRAGRGLHLAAVRVEPFHRASHRFLPRWPAAGVQWPEKTDYRSNSYKPTVGLSIYW